MQEHLTNAFLNAQTLITTFLQEKQNLIITENIIALLAATFTNGNKVMIAGNGGSACDALHFAEEFTGRYRKNRAALPVMTFSDVGHVTCVSNDFGFEQIFSRGIEAFGNKNDCFIGLSTSGNSENIITAFNKAKSLGVKTIALLGKDGGKIATSCACDHMLIIPGNTADRIQELHMTILHIVIEGVERTLFPENY